MMNEIDLCHEILWSFFTEELICLRANNECQKSASFAVYIASGSWRESVYGIGIGFGFGIGLSTEPRTAGCLFATERSEKRWIKPTAAGRLNGLYSSLFAHISLSRGESKRDWFPLPAWRPFSQFSAVSWTFQDGPFPSATSDMEGVMFAFCGQRFLTFSSFKQK